MGRTCVVLLRLSQERSDHRHLCSPPVACGIYLVHGTNPGGSVGQTLEALSEVDPNAQLVFIIFQDVFTSHDD